MHISLLNMTSFSIMVSLRFWNSTYMNEGVLEFMSKTTLQCIESQLSTLINKNKYRYVQYQYFENNHSNIHFTLLKSNVHVKCPLLFFTYIPFFFTKISKHYNHHRIRFISNCSQSFQYC